MNIELPTKKGNPNINPNIDFSQLVIIGANGAGKTRFGSNIERRYKQITHRISAQKSLSMPTFSGTKEKKVAESEFLYGAWMESNPNYYKGPDVWTRWNNKLETFLLNDYEKLMVLLHTEEYEHSLNYKDIGGAKPFTKLDKIQRIWETLLPHRKLRKKAGVIETYPIGQEANIYNGSEMSDGERVMFYLIGEVLCAPQDSIIIIDEPEMHIHRSLVKNLFDLIEIERSDCTFVYLTHDIDFAFTRQNAVKIWAKSYEGNNVWDYEFLDEEIPIPEQLYLEVLGSRKPVIFLEGDGGSIDYLLYEQVYSNYTIKPLGGCEKVIQTVKSFNEQNTFHHIQSFGIIDRDRRPDNDLPKFNAKGIWVLDVAEAENLLLLDGVVKAVAEHMGKNPVEVFDQVRQNLIVFFKSQLDPQVMLHFKEVLRRNLLDVSNFSAQDITSASAEIDGLYSAIDKNRIYDEIKTEFDEAIKTNNYDAVLRLFNLKNALIPQSKICDLTGIKSKIDFLNLVLTLLKRNDGVSQNIKDQIDAKVIKGVV